MHLVKHIVGPLNLNPKTWPEMIELYQQIPDADTVMQLQPEELASTLLFLLRERYGGQQFHLGNIAIEFENQNRNPNYYPIDRQLELKVAFHEASSWLVSQGLIVPSPNQNGGDWKILSRRARSFETANAFSAYQVASMLPKNLLHADIRVHVWSQFIRGEYGNAVFTAMRQVEINVRHACNFDDRVLGVDLMRRAFNAENGPLTDMENIFPEREARSNLFAGAIGSYKNAHSHRHVPLEDPAEATEIILLANTLLRIVDARVAARA